mmetsp:Transcript_16639/g.25042  ORF Transcript_16639/g.25042 Transcript_16639/m.25042 type:complete len:298 (+) Transcript_16639:148-1041(+)
MLSIVITLLSLGCIMFVFGTIVLARRIHFLSGSMLRYVDYIGIFALIASLLFIAQAVILIPLQTRENDAEYCQIGVWACIVFYASSKILVYIFLIEKSRIVNEAFKMDTDRYGYSLYFFNLSLMGAFSIIFALMIIYRIGSVDNHGVCRIGLRDPASIPLLIYDTTFSVYLVTLFLIPLLQYSAESPSILRLAQKNLAGASISTVFSFVNLLSIVLNHGKQPGHVCLFSCIVDVFANVMIMNWLLATPKKRRLDEITEIVSTTQDDATVNVIIEVGNRDSSTTPPPPRKKKRVSFSL